MVLGQGSERLGEEGVQRVRLQRRQYMDRDREIDRKTSSPFCFPIQVAMATIRRRQMASSAGSKSGEGGRFERRGGIPESGDLGEEE
ncbi:hypothetical protein IscW_ISCW018029 [Ixodes scapularis]|uniref:Uncharacterized protein n=1 Tax=Ixodes scapularis TaxID=6945 RepID=B7PE78_IXOSC|nr:hypothetical protein IscW_ISCW018029 [Ixodes scapularis]|eukprot:XP_002400235.1 hypothetical protein IscW_ISCW018029 [Ixodes scapularis]